jgi:hypothetical protein
MWNDDVRVRQLVLHLQGERQRRFHVHLRGRRVSLRRDIAPMRRQIGLRRRELLLQRSSQCGLVGTSGCVALCNDASQCTGGSQCVAFDSGVGLPLMRCQ